MAFACTHPDRETLVFGTNEPNWKGFPQVEVVSRSLRDTRLKAYIPYAKAAYYSLRDKELEIKKKLLNTNRENYMSDKNLLISDARQEAVISMRDNTAFLGGAGQVRLAFRLPEWSPNQPYYVCQGMMSYEIAKEWKSKEIKEYLISLIVEPQRPVRKSCTGAQFTALILFIDLAISLQRVPRIGFT